MQSLLGPGSVGLGELIEDQVVLSVEHLESNEAICLRDWSAVGNPQGGQAVELISASCN